MSDAQYHALLADRLDAISDSEGLGLLGGPAIKEAARIIRALSAPPVHAEPVGLLSYLVEKQGLHRATANLVVRFAQALGEKLAGAERKYGYADSWLDDHWRGDLVAKLAEHVQKGDPRDVAAYCAFAWHHGWSIAPDHLGDVTDMIAEHPASGEDVEGLREKVADADLNELRVICDVNADEGDGYRIQEADDLNLGVLRRILAALSNRRKS
jgi:hypothetical protein